jgi:hypothetical protein
MLQERANAGEQIMEGRHWWSFLKDGCISDVSEVLVTFSSDIMICCTMVS